MKTKCLLTVVLGLTALTILPGCESERRTVTTTTTTQETTAPVVPAAATTTETRTVRAY